MSTITVPKPINSSFDLADQLRQLRSRIAGRLRRGLRFATDLLHLLVGLGFGLFRRDSFTRLAADDPRRTQKF
jgi:hypothetical protein